MESHHFWAFFVIALIAGGAITLAISNATMTGYAVQERTFWERVFGQIPEPEPPEQIPIKPEPIPPEPEPILLGMECENCKAICLPEHMCWPICIEVYKDVVHCNSVCGSAPLTVAPGVRGYTDCTEECRLDYYGGRIPGMSANAYDGCLEKCFNKHIKPAMK